MVFSSHLQQSFDCALGVGDMESNQATFCTVIVKMAVQSFGCNVVGACCDINETCQVDNKGEGCHQADEGILQGLAGLLDRLETAGSYQWVNDMQLW